MLSEMPAYTILFRVRFLPVDHCQAPSAKLPVTQPVTRGVAAAKFLSNCIFGVLVTVFYTLLVFILLYRRNKQLNWFIV